ncbi:MAG: hypothetical protein H6R33_770 [Actinobacteria bacterium]|nr:hypothetical protein [Actinomycetota bacterium]
MALCRPAVPAKAAASATRPRGEPALPLDDVHPGGVGPVVVRRRQGQAQGGAEADPGSARGQLHEGGGGRGVAVEGLRGEPAEQRGGLGRVAAEAEQVLEAEAEAGLPGQGLRGADAHDLVPHRQHGVQAQGLVAGGVGEQVGVAAVGVGDVVVHGGEQGGGHEAPRGHRPPRVARLGVVEQHRAERPVDQVVPGERADQEVVGGVGVGPGHLDPLRPPRSERSAHLSSVLVAGPGRRRAAGQ